MRCSLRIVFLSLGGKCPPFSLPPAYGVASVSFLLCKVISLRLTLGDSDLNGVTIIIKYGTSSHLPTPTSSAYLPSVICLCTTPQQSGSAHISLKCQVRPFPSVRTTPFVTTFEKKITHEPPRWGFDVDV